MFSTLLSLAILGIVLLFKKSQNGAANDNGGKKPWLFHYFLSFLASEHD